MKAEKWNYKEHKYEEVEINDNCPLYERNLDRIINCANCGREVKYGETYTSRKYHNPLGFGYPVCEECYVGERNEEREWKEKEKKTEIHEEEWIKYGFEKKIKDLEEELKEYIYLLGKKEKEIEVKEKEINQLKEKREDFCNKLQNIRVRIADWNVEELAGAIKILKELEDLIEK